MPYNKQFTNEKKNVFDHYAQTLRRMKLKLGGFLILIYGWLKKVIFGIILIYGSLKKVIFGSLGYPVLP